MDNIVTSDLSRFGIRELQEASAILAQYALNRPEYLSKGIALNFNMNSGVVFLTDEDYNVAAINPVNQLLEQFISCPNCGNESFNLPLVLDISCAECAR